MRNVRPFKPLLGGEDSSYFPEKTRGSWSFRGTRDPEREPVPIPHHDPAFNPDERAIPLGMRLMTHLVAGFGRADRAR